jgi:hypothetical protein
MTSENAIMKYLICPKKVPFLSNFLGISSYVDVLMKSSHALSSPSSPNTNQHTNTTRPWPWACHQSSTIVANSAVMSSQLTSISPAASRERSLSVAVIMPISPSSPKSAATEVGEGSSACAAACACGDAASA